MSQIFRISIVAGNGKIMHTEACSTSCYRSGHKSDCICEGINSRVGKAQATRNTMEFCQVWFQDWLDAHASEFDPDWHAEMWVQLPLPGIVEFGSNAPDQ